MTEIPQWCCLLVRTRPENGEPDYHVVADGHWLVVSLSALYTLTGEEFSWEFEPAAHTGPRLDGLGLAGLTSVITLVCGW